MPQRPPASTPSRSTEGFLSLLGPGFLTRLYRRICLGPRLVPARGRGRRTTGWSGFVAGSADVGGLYRTFLRHDGLAAGLAAAGRLLVTDWRRVLETLRHGSADGAGPGPGHRAAGHRRRPAVAGARASAARWSAPSSTRSSARAVGRRYVVVGADNAGGDRGSTSGAGFVGGPASSSSTPGTESLLMQWDRAGRRTGRRRDVAP